MIDISGQKLCQLKLKYWKQDLGFSAKNSGGQILNIENIYFLFLYRKMHHAPTYFTGASTQLYRWKLDLLRTSICLSVEAEAKAFWRKKLALLGMNVFLMPCLNVT